ncbi:MAG: hypothetical protein ACE10K_02275, partial [Rhodothermales bacterium]
MIRVLSTRPNFIKIGALHHAFSAHPAIAPRLVHTGQHYHATTSKVFFDQLELPEPDLYLGRETTTSLRGSQNGRREPSCVNEGPAVSRMMHDGSRCQPSI